MSHSTTTIKGINLVGLSVCDLERTLAFYQAAVPLELVTRRPVSNGSRQFEGSDVALLRGPNGHLELVESGSTTVKGASPVPVEGPGFTHICFQSPAPANLYSRFLELGASPVSRGGVPVDLGGYGVLYGYARDADGIMFEVEQLDEPHFDGPVWIAHVALVSPDIDRLVDFYEQVLGVAPYRRVNKVTGPRVEEVTGLDGARIRAAWFNVGNMVLELWQYIIPATPEPEAPRSAEAPGYHRFVFEVGDLDSEIERLSSAGIEFLGSPTDSDGNREVDARDPDGNLFGLLQLPVGSEMSLDRLERIDWM